MFGFLAFLLIKKQELEQYAAVISLYFSLEITLIIHFISTVRTLWSCTGNYLYWPSLISSLVKSATATYIAQNLSEMR